MASGDGSEESVEGSSGGAGPPAEPVDAPHRSRSTDPVVDHSWLNRRSRARGTHLPRLSTVLLVTAFSAVLILYLLLQPG
ncbi:hypothetical protein [Nocardia flavorosea]|uniref:Uncharacterized protein n=1 Tax=Nocardia flavorosea TaxID=53429 RepID=A0A846YBT8_9NOCA|nr:hypothetical protein [Nocardia flavorosea]NKY55252.1 hypothetical protein [Nocardia flavorosea]